MTFEEWLAVGREHGFLPPGMRPWCVIHDSVPLTDDEVAVAADEGNMASLCVPVLRLDPGATHP